MSRNLRRHTRIEFPGIVRLSWQVSGNVKFARGRCVDLSESGMRVEVPEAIEVRSYVTVSAEKIRLSANASVRHCVRNGGKFVVGLEFSTPLKSLAEMLEFLAASGSSSSRS